MLGVKYATSYELDFAGKTPYNKSAGWSSR